MSETGDPQRTDEASESLWWLTLSPAIWIGHFLAVYITVAIFCARAASAAQALAPARWAIVGYTAVAAAGVIATGLRGLRRHRYGHAATPHDFDTPADRHRFIGFATLLLSGLSLVGILFVALPALFLETCR